MRRRLSEKGRKTKGMEDKKVGKEEGQKENGVD
jgi:hypothetical protein